MFGYVKTCTPQLRLCEWEAYRGIYCGLCRTLGRRFGPLARLTLSYDFTFYATLEMALREEVPEFRRRSCGVNPLRRCRHCEENEALNRAADMAILSLWYKAADTIADGGFLGRCGGRLLRAMLDEGRDFLFADAEDLTEIVRTGRLGGEEIRRILLPGLDVIRPEALAALRQLKKAGVCVLFAEKLPHIDALSGQQLQLAGEFEAVSVQKAVQIPDAQEPQFKTLSGPIVRQARYRTRDSKSMFFLLNPGRTESVVRLPGADARRCTALDPFTGTITQERLNRDWTVPAVRGIFIIIEE